MNPEWIEIVQLLSENDQKSIRVEEYLSSGHFAKHECAQE